MEGRGSWDVEAISNTLIRKNQREREGEIRLANQERETFLFFICFSLIHINP